MVKKQDKVIDKQRVIKTIFAAVDEVNQLSSQGEQLQKTRGTILFGKNGQLDSLRLVTLVVALEQKIEEEFGINIILADEKIISGDNIFLHDIGALTDYLYLLLKRKSNG